MATLCVLRSPSRPNLLQQVPSATKAEEAAASKDAKSRQNLMATKLKKAEFTAAELKAEGSTATDLKEAKFTAAELRGAVRR